MLKSEILNEVLLFMIKFKSIQAPGTAVVTIKRDIPLCYIGHPQINI